MALIDLHIHSQYSNDGEYSPQELISMCAHSSLKVVAIADHNCIDAIDEGRKLAQEYGLTLIPAIELDCTYADVNLHLLGYYIEPDKSIFDPVKNSIISQEQKTCQKRMALIREAGIDFDQEFANSLARNSVVTSEMIAEAALALDKNRNNPYLSPYYPGGSRSDNPFVNFYWDYCAQGKPFFVPATYMSLHDACTLIRKTGGVPVLAHPGNNIKENEELLQNIFQEDVCGMEVFSSYHNQVQTDFYLRWSQQLGVIPTYGSDFHGKTKPSITLGSIDCQEQAEEICYALQKARR